MNPIITQSRYGDKRTIECVDPKQGIFKVYGKSCFARQADGMFDFEGGPMFLVGEQFYGLGDIVGIEIGEKPEDQSLGTCIYVSIDMNWRTVNELMIDKLTEPRV